MGRFCGVLMVFTKNHSLLPICSDAEKAAEYWKRYTNFDDSAIVGKYR